MSDIFFYISLAVRLGLFTVGNLSGSIPDMCLNHCILCLWIVSVKGLKRRTQLFLGSFCRALERHLPCVITLATTQVNVPHFNPSQAGRYLMA